jgi:hypothetical protein
LQASISFKDHHASTMHTPIQIQNAKSSGGGGGGGAKNQELME